jgi:hypothetical protein
MISIFSHKGNVDRNDRDSISSQSYCQSPRKQTTINAVENAGKKSIYTLLWECKLVQPLRKSVLRLIKKVKIPYNPAVSLLGISKGM